MTRSKIVAAVGGAALALMLLGAAPAAAWDRGNVQTLTVLPNLKSGQQSSVEGLTVGPDGNIYVVSFGFNTTGSTTGPADLFVIAPSGHVIKQVTLSGSPAASPHMLGLAFNPFNRHLLVLDFGSGFGGTANVLDVNPATGVFQLFGTVPTAPGGSGPGVNALTFDRHGNVYVSDSFQGIIWTAPPNCGGCQFTQWVNNQTLLGPGTGLTPPFGANGLEFSNDRSVMYVANTAQHQIIQIPVTDGHGNGPLVPGTPAILITGINAPDGIAVDPHGNIWVCANQEDEIVVIDPSARNPVDGTTVPKVIAKLGDFNGIGNNGIAKGFLFPASPAFSKDGGTLYVSNLTLYLPYAGANAAIDSDWTLQVKGYTVSQIPAVIPPIAGGSGH
jgi:sugar lactone lactonase YvrE